MPACEYVGRKDYNVEMRKQPKSVGSGYLQVKQSL